jgi:hypothetical protein
MLRQCDAGAPPGCVPGCADPKTGAPNWCAPHWTAADAAFYSCAFGPDDTLRMLSHHEQHWHSASYNEVVLDTAHWEARLPATVEAFVVARGGDLRAACDSHRRWAQLFPNARTPLVSYDSADATTPFREEECLGRDG